MKKTACCIALAVAASFSTVVMADSDKATQCIAEFQPAKGEKVTAYLQAADCARLKENVKPGDAVRMLTISAADTDLGAAQGK